MPSRGSATLCPALAGAVLTLVAGFHLPPTRAPNPGQSEATGGYQVDLARARSLWPGEPAVASVEDLFRLTLDLGERRYVAETHLFPGPLRIVPFHDEDDVFDAAGNAVSRGDHALAQYFPPGAIGFAVRHRRPGHRLLRLDAGLSELKSELQLRDSHVEILVGVVREGEPGVVSVNLPQAYENGRFGGPSYPLILFAPELPKALEPSLKARFVDNIRTYAVGFDAVARFPLSYSGGDPLAASTRAAVARHAEAMVRAIAGDAEARRWFTERRHLLYCSELAHLATTAGMLYPLNAETFVPRVGAETWQRFTAAVGAHNRGRPSAFTELNSNPWIRTIDLAIAPADLRPAPDYAPELNRPGRALAFRPLTLADLAEQFLQVHLPRKTLGEGVASHQARLLRALEPALWDVTEIDQLDSKDKRRLEAETLFERLVSTVGRDHGDYGRFRQAIEPLLVEAARIASPRSDGGEGLYVPPTLFHLMAQGRWPAGMVEIRYVGHGMHYSLVRGPSTN